MRRMASLLLALLACTPAFAASKEELVKYDNVVRNGRLDPGKEIDIYALHQIRAALAKYDVNKNGDLDPEELGAIRAAFREAPTDPKDLAKAASLQDEAARRGGIPIDDLVSIPPKKSSACDDQQGLYVRREKVDISIYNASIDKSSAQGAAVSYTDDHLSGNRAANIQGVASYVFARSPCLGRPEGIGTFDGFVSGYAMAAWLQANGRYSNTPTSDKSSLRFGLDSQFQLFSGPLFDNQYFTASPYYQSDFRGLASAYGFSASWEPFKLDWKLGGTYQQISPYFDFFYQLKAEVDTFRVDRVGLTDLKARTDYAWLGGTARANVFLFPEYLDYRFMIVASYKYYWDANSKKDIGLASVSAAYNIVPDGSTSVSVEYQKGTEKSTLKKIDQVMVNLNYKY